MKIIFCGTPEFACPTLEMLNEKYEVVLVVTQPDKLGKRNKLEQSAVKKKALELNLEVYQPNNIKEEYQKIIDMNADILITAAYGQFIPKKLLDSFKLCLNIHGSILPRHRGGAPIQRALINGDKTTGITIQKMVPKMDSGEVYCKKEIEILDTDNNSTLFSKLSIIGMNLLKDNLEDIYNHKLRGVAQDETKATYSYNLTKEEELIDFNDTAVNIFNRIRGLANEPGAYFSFKEQTFKVYESKIIIDDSLVAAGTILCCKKELIIKTKDNAIAITKIKPAGKNILDITNYLNGQRLFIVGEVIA